MTIFKQCDELLAAGHSVVMATVIKTSGGTPGKPGFKLLLTDDGNLHGTVGGGALERQVIEEAREVLNDHQNRIQHYNLADLNMKCGGNVDVVIEFVQSIRRILLFGGGHIGRALAPILESLGFAVTVIDPRSDVQPHFADTTTIIQSDYEDLSGLAELVQGVEWVFVATHGHAHDYAVLRQLLGTSSNYRYVGMIGAKMKVETTRKKLQEEGIAIPEYFYAPVGIRLGGQTAAEIAVSVAAEIVAVLNQTGSDHMRRR